MRYVYLIFCVIFVLVRPGSVWAQTVADAFGDTEAVADSGSIAQLDTAQASELSAVDTEYIPVDESTDAELKAIVPTDVATESDDVLIVESVEDRSLAQFDGWGGVAEEDLGFETKVNDFRAHRTDEGTGFAETIELAENSKGGADLCEVLSKSVGVQVRSMGGLGAYGAASVRGSTPNQVPVFFDSVQLNTGGNSAVNLGDFSLDVLDSIEIYRGNAPLALGNSGIGGAIVLRSRVLTEPVIELAGSYGSWHTMRLFGLYGNKLGSVDTLAIVSAQHSDGDFWYFNQKGTFKNSDDDEFQNRTNNDHSAYSILLKLSRDLGGWRVLVMDHFLYKEHGLAGIDSFAGRSDARMKTIRNGTNILFERPVGEKSELDFDLSYLLLWELFDDQGGSIGTGHQDHKYRTDAVGASALLNTEFSKEHSTVFRFSSRFERYNEFRKGLSHDDQQNPSYRIKTEMGGEYDWHPVSPFHIVPTVRGEFHYSYFGGGKISALVTDFDATEKTDFYFSPSIGVRYELFKGFLLRANGGRYVRTPDLTELFGDRGAVIGNPELVAESGYNVDAGVTYMKSGRSLVDFFRMDAAWFGSRVIDLISLEQNSQSTSRPVNVDEASILGAEFALRLGLFDLVTLSGNYTLFRGVNRSSLEQYEGKKLPVRPTHEAYGCIELGTTLGPLIVKGWFDADYAGRAYLGRYNNEDFVSKHFFLGLGSRVEHPRTGFTISIEVKNVLNKLRYENENGDWRAMSDYGRYPLPGRTVMATLHWRLPQ